MRNLLLIFLPILVWTACREDSHPENQVSNLHKTEISGDSINEPALYSDGANEYKSIITWPALMAFNHTILKFKDADTIYNIYSKQLRQELNAMQISIPSRLNTNEVKAYLHKMNLELKIIQKMTLKNYATREAISGNTQKLLKAYEGFTRSLDELPAQETTAK